MSEKNIKGRIINKHDIENNWKSLGINFIPRQGEFIIYDIDEVFPYERFKIGDGIHNVNDLPFFTDNLNIPTKLSELINDSGFLTADNILNNNIILQEPQDNDIPKVFIDGIIPTTKDEVLAELNKNNLIPKVIKFVYDHNKKTSNVFLVKAVKNAKKGLVVEKPIIIERQKKIQFLHQIFLILFN